MKSKKGIYLIGEEGLNLFIAAIVIVFLIYLGYQVYNITVAKSDLEKAKSILNDITGKIDILEEGQEADYLINGLGKIEPKEPFSDNSWFINKFGKEIDSPKSCDKKNCLCICKYNVKFINYEKDAEAKGSETAITTTYNKKGACENYGVCKQIDKEIGLFYPRELFIFGGVYQISIFRENNLFYIYDNSQYELRKNTKDFILSNFNGKSVFDIVSKAYEDKKVEDKSFCKNFEDIMKNSKVNFPSQLILNGQKNENVNMVICLFNSPYFIGGSQEKHLYNIPVTKDEKTFYFSLNYMYFESTK